MRGKGVVGDDVGEDELHALEGREVLGAGDIVLPLAGRLFSFSFFLGGATWWSEARIV